MASFKVLLCIPPDYDYNFPPLGTPALVAFLKNKGIAAEQTDLNLKYRDFLVSRILCPSLSLKEKRHLLKKIIMKKFFMEKLKNRYYSRFLYKSEYSDRLPYDNNTNSSFYFTERLLSSELLWRYLEDRAENTFYQFYENENFLDSLDKRNIDLLGISIISPSQAIPSLTLGLLVKKYLPHIHICIGGQWPTLYRRIISEKKELFKCFDSIIIFEGETSLYKLATAIKNSKDISYVPNIILKDNKPDLEKNQKEENLDLLPCPDFDGLSLDRYAGRMYDKLSLTYEASRGCYWSKCTYCVDLPLPKPLYRMKSPNLIIRDMKELRKRYKAGALMFGDPGLSPRHMLEISKQILKERVEIDWWCMARLDPGFNFQMFKLARRAGLKQINFGFESANDKVCETMHKGNKKEHSLRIIKDCSRAGIRVYLQTMLGLPKETFADSLETVDFLIANKKNISNVVFNTYYLTPSNFIYLNPEKYGIEYENNRQLPFRFFIPFKNLKGMSQKEADLLEQLYNTLLIKKDKDENSRKDINATSKGRLEFSLNGESMRANYVRNKKTKEFYFVNRK